MSAPSVILLTGAPPASDVTASTCSVTRFDEHFHALLDLPKDSPCGTDGAIASQQGYVAWRSLPLDRLPLLPGQASVVGRGHDEDETDGGAGFFLTTAHVSDSLLSREDTSSQDLWTQFCEQSLALHHEPDPLCQRPDDESDVVVDDETTSFMTTLSAEPDRVVPEAPVPLHLSDLEDVPPARHITALQPQTVTLNLIVGVLSVASPRSVTTRWGQTLSLVEVLVGDNTAAGFAVTFWLAADEAQESSVGRLRRQDVVLMENVALHVFRAKVYGQSLRKALTRVTLLWRRDGSGHYSTRLLDREDAAKHPQLEKARLVKDWVLRFVGRDAASTARRPRKSWDKPPDDTQ